MNLTICFRRGKDKAFILWSDRFGRLFYLFYVVKHLFEPKKKPFSGGNLHFLKINCIFALDFADSHYRCNLLPQMGFPLQ